MMKILLSLLILICTSNFTFSQGQQFADDFGFLSFTIKDTYAGYRDKTKGSDFDALLSKIKRSNSKDTFALLSQMTTFFHDHHLILYDGGISKKKIDSQQCKKDSQMVQRYFTSKKIKDRYEGYWINEYNNCVIALKKVRSNPATYYAYVMESKVKAITGFCLFKMVHQKDGTYYTDYIGENLGFRTFLHAKFKNENILWVNSFGGKWRRIVNYKPGVLMYKTIFSFKPGFEKVDTSTVLLKMHDFGPQNVTRFDSLFKANKSAIDSATTLIIDIRNNAGGYVNCYLPLLPYIYTNPIVHVGGCTLISNNFLKQYDESIQKYTENGDTASLNNYIAYRDTFVAKKGQFDCNQGNTLAENLPILANPKNVAVIINNNCLSAAELMLLNFRQSSKVKFFGERTGGATDYLNAMSFKLPYHDYYLRVASTKRIISAKEPSYDGKGIPPDIEISDDIADWVAFVKKYYDEHK